LGWRGLVPWLSVVTLLSPLVAFQAVVGLYFRKQVNRIIEWVRPVSLETQVLREGLQLLEANDSNRPNCAAWQRRLKGAQEKYENWSEC
jgi:hypothetical protein